MHLEDGPMQSLSPYGNYEARIGSARLFERERKLIKIVPDVINSRASGRLSFAGTDAAMEIFRCGGSFSPCLPPDCFRYCAVKPIFAGEKVHVVVDLYRDSEKRVATYRKQASRMTSF